MLLMFIPLQPRFYFFFNFGIHMKGLSDWAPLN